MAEQRRTLIDGLNKPDAERAKEASFVFGDKPAAPEEARPEPAAPEQRPHLPGAGRVPLTTRVRADLAERLKRLSLERQLSGEHPSAIQDIVEDALQLWLLKNNPQP